MKIPEMLLLGALVLLSQLGYAQSLRQIPNANFSQWADGMPSGWNTNNLYNDQNVPQLVVVVPAGTSGARLLVKQFVFYSDQPMVASWYGGELNSTLIPYMPAEGKPVALTVRYQFRPDSADVLRAEIGLDTRDRLPNNEKPDPACLCQFKGIDGPVTLPPGQQSVTFQATFTNPASPNLVPRGCNLYIWRIRFWLENKVTHLHGATEAIIDQITLQP